MGVADRVPSDLSTRLFLILFIVHPTAKKAIPEFWKTTGLTLVNVAEEARRNRNEKNGTHRGKKHGKKQTNGLSGWNRTYK